MVSIAIACETFCEAIAIEAVAVKAKSIFSLSREMESIMLSETCVKNQKGFSLIELLIVMVILGLLASLVGPRMFGKLGSAKQNTAKTQVEMLMTALDAYRLDMGQYPSQQDGGFEALVKNPGNEKWGGPYLAKGVPLDPWGNPYNYRFPGEHGEIDVFSLGADNLPGGSKEDRDVVSWE